MYLVGPTLSFSPRSDMTLQVSAFAAWRESTNDGVYLPGMAVAPGTVNSKSSEIGQIFNGALMWRVNPNTTFIFDYGHVQAGKAIKEANGSSLSFGAVTAVLRF